MSSSHNIILIVGVLCLLATFSGLLSERFGTPLLLVFIGIGMLAGEDGPGGFVFSDYQSAYLIGSVALTLILFEGGLHTKREMIREAFWPSAVLATVGVAVSALLVGTAAFLLFRISFIDGLLLGAAIAPTDAAAVSVLLRVSKVVVPKRVIGALEIESGLNDPMSVFLTVVLVQVLTSPGGVSVGRAAMLFAEEMGGGVLIGALGGYLLLWLFRTLRVDRSVSAVLAFGGALAIFGGAQAVGASGFLAVYLAGVVLACYEHTAREPIVQFFGALGWLAQIALFLMLGLLVTPHVLPQFIVPALMIAAVLMFVARPLGVMTSLLPFGWKVSETVFVAWAGLRGGVPIFLTIISLLRGVRSAQVLFDVVFVVVVVSVAAQGMTAAPLARLLKLRGDPRTSVAEMRSAPTGAKVEATCD